MGQGLPAVETGAARMALGRLRRMTQRQKETTGLTTEVVAKSRGQRHQTQLRREAAPPVLSANQGHPANRPCLQDHPQQAPPLVVAPPRIPPLALFPRMIQQMAEALLCPP